MYTLHVCLHEDPRLKGDPINSNRLTLRALYGQLDVSIKMGSYNIFKTFYNGNVTNCLPTFGHLLVKSIEKILLFAGTKGHPKNQFLNFPADISSASHWS